MTIIATAIYSIPDINQATVEEFKQQLRNITLELINSKNLRELSKLRERHE